MREVRRRILVVDDEECIRRNLRIYLEDEGFEVSDVQSGEEALEILVRQPFEAAIVDMRLPGIDGNAFIEEAHKVDSTLGFLIFTGSAGYQLPERLTRIGLRESQVFRKPLGDMTGLVKALAGILRERQDSKERG